MIAKQDRWMRLKKILAILVSVSLWLASMQFSYQGFNLAMPEMSWLGWVLAIAVTVIELVFNTDVQRLNLTLFAAGLLAYAYGIWTNVAGFFAVQGGTFETLKSNPLSILFPLLVGVFLEVVPEPLFVWGLGVTDKGDPIGNIFKGQNQMDDWVDSVNNKTRIGIEQEHFSRLPKRRI